MDGANRRTVALLTYFWGEHDARGLAVDVKMNRIYFVSYFRSSVLYIDLNAAGHASGPVRVLFYDYWYFYSPRGLALDDQYVYWNEYMTEKVYRINKFAWDGNVEVVASGMYSPRGMAIKKGNATRDGEYCCIYGRLHLFYWISN